MRAGSCAVQQALTSEAAGVVKQAVTLAKRRGHAQVTPLHVANTMLSSPTGLLRLACLQSHSHPLQCKALELCFNVALNRLQASSSSSVLGHHHTQHPTISNALVAAFKRAQAHQRRGSIENQQQQQPVLTVKIELEQLIISILDDPSVSRVMREAGFSSPQVKTNVEKSVSLEFRPQNSSSINKSKENSSTLLTLHPASPLASQDGEKTSESVRNEDLSMIIETLVTNKKRKSFVMVGESISNIENTVRGLMHKVDKGELPHQALREAKFVTLPPFYSFCNLQREEVEHKLGELTCLLKSLVAKGVVLYLGDLKWISDYRVNLEQQRSYYCSLEHTIMEIGRLASGIGEMNGRFWLMGVATFQTYMKCRNGSSSLETIWGLHPVTIPANSLGLSLLSEREEQSEIRHERGENGSCKLVDGEENISLSPGYAAKFESETRKVLSNVPTLSSLPPWLKNECKRLSNNDQKYDSSKEFHKSWKPFESLSQKHPKSLERTLTIFSPPSLSSPTSCFSFDQQNPNFHQQKIFPILSENSPSNAKYALNSASSSETIEDMEYVQKFKEFNTENLNIICNALERKVPCKKEIIPKIAGTVLQCRSGMLRRQNNLRNSETDAKEETWMFFLGHDANEAKERISKELARIVFGSYSSFVSIGISRFGALPTTTDSTELDYGSKRGRDEETCTSYVERFAQEVSTNPHRVFLIEDLEEADCNSQMAVKRAIESGRISNGNGEEVGLCDAVVVLSSEKFRSRSRVCSPLGSCSVSLDLNVTLDDFDSQRDEDDDHLNDELGILKIVDRLVVFK